MPQFPCSVRGVLVLRDDLGILPHTSFLGFPCQEIVVLNRPETVLWPVLSVMGNLDSVRLTNTFHEKSA